MMAFRQLGKLLSVNLLASSQKRSLEEEEEMETTGGDTKVPRIDE